MDSASATAHHAAEHIAQNVEFRRDPEYRRIGWYIVVSFSLMAVFIYWLFHRIPGFQDGAIGTSLFLVLISALGIVPLRWRMRVDKQGIWRRRLWYWELWDWESFASGRLKQGFEDREFVDLSRPWWRRTLPLSSLSKQDRATVWGYIRLVWRPPEPTPLPDFIELKHFPRNTTFRFDNRGVSTDPAGTVCCDWSTMESVEIRRLRHDRVDFRRLTIKFPGHRIRLSCQGAAHGRTNQNWSGAEPSVLARFLASHVPPDRLLIVAFLDPPATVAEAEARARDALKHRRYGRLMILCLFVLTLPLAAYGFLAADPRVASPLFLLLASLPTLVAEDRREHRKYAKLVQAGKDLARSADADQSSA